MYILTYDNQFKIDYRNFKRNHPELKKELKNVLEQLQKTGTVSSSYNPHILDNFGGNYNGHMEFHLSDGKVDVLVLYMPHKTNPKIRLVRIGSHKELFQGPTK